MKAHTEESQKTITPDKALQFLIEGNQRFVNNLKINRNLLAMVDQTTEGQWPFATILSCIDSRTSAELVFDQGLGDIFSIRIAGNFVNKDILGSMEFACKISGSKLIMVLGHTKCGALKGGLDIDEVSLMGLENLTHLVHKFNHAIDVEIKPNELRHSSNVDLLDRITHRNVYLAAQAIRDKSPCLAEMEQKGEIMIAGGVYDVESGLVEILPNI